jgi:C4-dicarboxylate-specific signal transduction histidine kinase
VLVLDFETTGAIHLGRLRGGYRSSGEGEAVALAATGCIQLPDYHYYSALTLAAVFDAATPDRQNEWRQAIAEHLEQLREWAENCSVTFLDKHILVSAEFARIECRDLDAMRLYEQAIRSAHANGFVHNEALANELAARFYAARSFEKISHAYLRDTRIAVLKLLASQAAISLENSRLYRDLEEREAKIRRLVDANIIGIFIGNVDGGSRMPALVGAAVFEGSRNEGVAFVLDLSEQKRAEAEVRKHREELAHLSWVAVMGEMARALAHELNQPLTGIVNNASAARRFIAKGRADLPKLDGLFEAVREDGRRAGEIIRGIRGMVHKGKEICSPVNLNDVISEVSRFARSDALEHHCVLVRELDPELPLVEADRVQLQQVLLNLIVNAFEAMRETPAPERRVIIRSERESGGQVRVSVRDFGIGLREQEPERIFERFFSTKREGMGMGLAIARSIIASHGGELAAANADGGGACVYFSLPVTGKDQ